MSRSRRGKKAGEDAERLLQEAFGVSEDQLLKDFILAQTEVKDSDIPPEPENQQLFQWMKMNPLNDPHLLLAAHRFIS